MVTIGCYDEIEYIYFLIIKVEIKIARLQLESLILPFDKRIRIYCTLSMFSSNAEKFPWLRASEAVQKDKIRQNTTNAAAKYPVIFFKISGVDVPNIESEASPPPKEAPKPPPLPS